MKRCDPAIKYFWHNLIGHPLVAIFDVMGMHATAKKIHDGTLPKSGFSHGH